jgi:hypothetical protein
MVRRWRENLEHSFFLQVHTDKAVCNICSAFIHGYTLFHFPRAVTAVFLWDFLMEFSTHEPSEL